MPSAELGPHPLDGLLLQEAGVGLWIPITGQIHLCALKPHIGARVGLRGRALA